MAEDITYQARAATYFDEAAKEPIRQQLIGRQLFAKQTLIGEDKYRVNFQKITEMGRAQTGRGIPSVGTGKDNVKISGTDIELVLFWKEYEIPRQDWELFKTTNTNLSTVASVSAAQVVGVEEDAYLINGWKPDGTNYIEKGLYQVAGNSASGADFGTFGNPTKSIMAAFDALDNDNIQGVNYNLLLHPTQFNQAMSSRSTNGVREWADLIEMLNPYPNAAKGNIIKVFGSNITAGTGLMTPVDPAGKFMDLVVGANYVNDVYLNGPSEKFSPMGGLVVSGLIERVVFPDAICTLSGV